MAPSPVPQLHEHWSAEYMSGTIALNQVFLLNRVSVKCVSELGIASSILEMRIGKD